jgi:protein-disulfide isomerase
MEDIDRIKKLLTLIVAILVLQVIFSILILYCLTIPLSANSIKGNNLDTAGLIKQLTQGSGHVQGSRDAPVTMILFADFQCPYCNEVFPIVSELVSTYKEKMEFSFHHFPLSGHNYAGQAAPALEAAGSQNKYWEMYNLIIEEYREKGDEALTKERLYNCAKKLGLNMTDFSNDINEKRNQNIIQKDMGNGEKLGVQGIPTVYINTRKVVGVQDYDTYAKIIEEELGPKSST